MCAIALSSACDQLVGAGEIGEDVARGEIGGAREAAVEMRRTRSSCARTRNRRSRHRARTSGGGRETGGAARRLVASRGRRTISPSTVRRGCASGSPLPVVGEQDRGAAVDLDIGGVGRQARDQDHRRAVDVGRDVDQRGERMPGVAVEGRQRSGADRAQQAPWRRLSGAKSAGSVAFSGMRPGMAPGSGRALGLGHEVVLSSARAGADRKTVGSSQLAGALMAKRRKSLDLATFAVRHRSVRRTVTFRPSLTGLRPRN